MAKKSEDMLSSTRKFDDEVKELHASRMASGRSRKEAERSFRDSGFRELISRTAAETGKSRP